MSTVENSKVSDFKLLKNVAKLNQFQKRKQEFTPEGEGGSGR